MARILVIDDDKMFREMLQKTLEKAGYEVLVASDGHEGINIFHKKWCNLVITDIIMPDKDGAEVIFELEKVFPDIKIIVMTSGGQGDTQTYIDSILTCSEAVKGAFEKPFHMKDMISKVQEILGEK